MNVTVEGTSLVAVFFRDSNRDSNERGGGLFNWLQGLSGVSVPSCQTNSFSVTAKSEWDSRSLKDE